MCDTVFEEWQELSKDYKDLESKNETYLKKLNELSAYQQQCIQQITHQRYRMNAIKNNLSQLKDEDKVEEMLGNFMKREAELQTIEETLPKETDMYLKIVLGSINVSFLNKEAKFKYKDDYEKFKLIVNVIGFVIAVICLYTAFRSLEILLLFLLVWYYCTLSIRESILKTNGSRIKGWWRIHHVLSTIAAGVLLIWPATGTWGSFRYQFLLYTIYGSLIQYLQFKYQRGVLYRLKALGERYNMDITIEGFHSWMWRGLALLFPFLLIGYCLQLANAVALYKLSYHPQATWHIPLLSLIFFVFFVGNTWTTLSVIPRKIKEEMKLKYKVMAQSLYTYGAKNSNKKK